jgi:membrane-associated PAP2 superfamily phosphatase
MPVPVSDLPAARHPPTTAVPRPVPAGRRPGFLRLRGQVPLLLLGLVFAAWTLLQGDLWLADRLYAWEGHAWTLRHAWATQDVVHLRGREASTGAWLAVFAAWLVACARSSWQPLRRPLLYLLLATALSTLLIAWIKSWSNVDCPWDLVRYGGTRAYFGVFGLRPAGTGPGACFPAGHAGGGYAWLALYYFLLAVKPRLRWLGLAVGLAAGLLFGIAQQLRGAHFLSHDLAAILVCWGCATALQRAFWRDAATAASRRPQPALPAGLAP